MNIPGRFFSQAERLEGRRALLHKQEGLWREISWKEFSGQVSALASYLVSIGLSKGDRVALLSENRPEWAISDLAILSAGGITVPIYYTNTSSQIEYIIEDASPKIIVVSTPGQLEKLLGSEAVRAVEEIIILDRPESTLPDNVKLLSHIADMAVEEITNSLAGIWGEIKEDDVASILYTSGTTGDPKGVMLSHKNIISNADACMAVVGIKEDDLFLSFLPLSHAFERTVGYYVPLFSGSTIAYAESIEKLLLNIQELSPTIMIGVPRFYEKTYAAIVDAVEKGSALKRSLFRWALDSGREYAATISNNMPMPALLMVKKGLADFLIFKKVRSKLGGSLRFFVSGGAPLSGEVYGFFDALGVTILEGYGLTETSPVITCNSLTHRKSGTVGKPLPGVEVDIAEDGEVITKGPHIMKGYYNKDDMTSEMIKDGWFCTGDIGSIDGEGYLTLTDRKKDIIVTSGGKNVSPQNIETALISDPLISQVMVYGDRKKYLTALVVPNMEALLDKARPKGINCTLSTGEFLKKQEVHNLYSERIEKSLEGFAPFERVIRFALMEEEFSMENGEITPTLKIKRKFVTEKYRSILEGLYLENGDGK